MRQSCSPPASPPAASCLLLLPLLSSLGRSHPRHPSDLSLNVFIQIHFSGVTFVELTSMENSSVILSNCCFPAFACSASSSSFLKEMSFNIWLLTSKYYIPQDQFLELLKKGLVLEPPIFLLGKKFSSGYIVVMHQPLR